MAPLAPEVQLRPMRRRTFAGPTGCARPGRSWPPRATGGSAGGHGLRPVPSGAALAGALDQVLLHPSVPSAVVRDVPLGDVGEVRVQAVRRAAEVVPAQVEPVAVAAGVVGPLIAEVGAEVRV